MLIEGSLADLCQNAETGTTFHRPVGKLRSSWAKSRSSQTSVAGGARRKLKKTTVPDAVLISTYELGHQPFGLASPAAWLRREGIATHLFDLAKDKLDAAIVGSAA